MQSRLVGHRNPDLEFQTPQPAPSSRPMHSYAQDLPDRYRTQREGAGARVRLTREALLPRPGVYT